MSNGHCFCVSGIGGAELLAAQRLVRRRSHARPCGILGQGGLRGQPQNAPMLYIGGDSLKTHWVPREIDDAISIGTTSPNDDSCARRGSDRGEGPEVMNRTCVYMRG